MLAVMTHGPHVPNLIGYVQKWGVFSGGVPFRGEVHGVLFLWVISKFRTVEELIQWSDKGQNPLHQFPRSKSVTRWRLRRLRESYGKRCL